MSGAPPGLATFDSSTAMLRATARFLHGRDFPALGEPRALEPLAAAVNLLPDRLRTVVFSLGGATEGVSAHHVQRIRADEVAAWMAAHYPRRRYPAAMIGSSNGALVHACAAMGIPWLPQTFLVLVRNRSSDPDDARAAMESGTGPAHELAKINPGVAVHHMHDPVQDRLMTPYVAYFRLKYRRLPPAYRELLAGLAPGATLFVVECGESWPLVTRGERGYFQFGAVGGPTARDYMEGGPRVARYLQAQGTRRSAWDPPPPDIEGPEAEWGFDEALRADIEHFAAQHKLRIVRLAFDHPEDMSPLVADLYRRWYAEHGRATRSLLIESFVLLEPYWVWRAGQVPFWMVFNVERSLPRIERYLERSGPFDDIRLMLFPNGTKGMGQGSTETWRTVLRRARRRGEFVGVDERRFPADFAAFARYHTDLKSVGERRPLPSVRPPAWFEEFVRRHGPAAGVRVI